MDHFFCNFTLSVAIFLLRSPILLSNSLIYTPMIAEFVVKTLVHATYSFQNTFPPMHYDLPLSPSVNSFRPEVAFIVTVGYIMWF